MRGTRGKGDCQDVLAYSLSLHHTESRCAVWAAQCMQNFERAHRAYYLASSWLGVAKAGVMGQRTPGASAMVSLCCRLSGRQAPVQAPSGGASGSRTFCGLLDSLPPGQAVGFNPPALGLTW